MQTSSTLQTYQCLLRDSQFDQLCYFPSIRKSNLCNSNQVHFLDSLKLPIHGEMIKGCSVYYLAMKGRNTYLKKVRNNVWGKVNTGTKASQPSGLVFSVGRLACHIEK